MRIHDSDLYLTPAEMAAKLRISLRTLQHLMKTRQAPRHVRLGGKVLFVVETEVRHDQA